MIYETCTFIQNIIVFHVARCLREKLIVYYVN